MSEEQIYDAIHFALASRFRLLRESRARKAQLGYDATGVGGGTSFLKEGTRADGSNLERFVSCFSWKPDVEGWIYRLLRHPFDCSTLSFRGNGSLELLLTYYVALRIFLQFPTIITRLLSLFRNDQQVS